MLSDLTRVLADHRANITYVDIHDAGEPVADIYFEFTHEGPAIDPVLEDMRKVEGVRLVEETPNFARIYGKRIIVMGGGAQVGQVAIGAISEADRHNIRGERISVDTIPLVGEAALADAVRAAAFVVEAALEDLALKQALFRDIEAAAPPDAILASNTSVIPITRIMQGLRDRSRALGTHWWNPPFLVPLVEVIGTEWTAPAAIEATLALHAAVGKTPVHVRRDVAGFVGNRLQHALWREAIALVQEGVCDAGTVDTVVKASFGRRLAVLGPLENADLVGTDLTLAIHRTVLPELDRTPGPLPYLERLVAEGKLGMKSGEGFHEWTAEEQAALRKRLVEHLKRSP